MDLYRAASIVLGLICLLSAFEHGYQYLKEETGNVRFAYFLNMFLFAAIINGAFTFAYHLSK